MYNIIMEIPNIGRKIIYERAKKAQKPIKNRKIKIN